MRLRRHPDLLLGWRPEGFLVRNLSSGTGIVGPADVVRILDVFDAPRTPHEAASLLPDEDRAGLLRDIATLRRLGFLIAGDRPG